jgi:hypothetical protein
MKNLSPDRQWPGRDVNQAPAKYKSRELPLDQPVQFEFVSVVLSRLCLTIIRLHFLHFLYIYSLGVIVSVIAGIMQWCLLFTVFCLGHLGHLSSVRWE